jgi:hypothetical protein
MTNVDQLTALGTVDIITDIHIVNCIDDGGCKRVISIGRKQITAIQKDGKLSLPL